MVYKCGSVNVVSTKVEDDDGMDGINVQENNGNKKEKEASKKKDIKSLIGIFNVGGKVGNQRNIPKQQHKETKQIPNTPKPEPVLPLQEHPLYKYMLKKKEQPHTTNIHPTSTINQQPNAQINTQKPTLQTINTPVQ